MLEHPYMQRYQDCIVHAKAAMRANDLEDAKYWLRLAHEWRTRLSGIQVPTPPFTW